MFVLFQDVWCGRPEVREKEVDPLFRGGHRHHLLCGALRLRPGAGRGRGDEQVSQSVSQSVVFVSLSVPVILKWRGYQWDTRWYQGISWVSELSIAAISWHRTIILRSRHLNPNTDQQFITAKCMFLLWRLEGLVKSIIGFYYFSSRHSTLGSQINKLWKTCWGRENVLTWSRWPLTTYIGSKYKLLQCNWCKQLELW